MAATTIYRLVVLVKMVIWKVLPWSNRIKDDFNSFTQQVERYPVFQKDLYFQK